MNNLEDKIIFLVKKNIYLYKSREFKYLLIVNKKCKSKKIVNIT